MKVSPFSLSQYPNKEAVTRARYIPIEVSGEAINVDYSNCEGAWDTLPPFILAIGESRDVARLSFTRGKQSPHCPTSWPTGRGLMLTLTPWLSGLGWASKLSCCPNYVEYDLAAVHILLTFSIYTWKSSRHLRASIIYHP